MRDDEHLRDFLCKASPCELVALAAKAPELAVTIQRHVREELASGRSPYRAEWYVPPKPGPTKPEATQVKRRKMRIRWELNEARRMAQVA